MLSFFKNIFDEKSNSRNVCGNYENPYNVIQECMGCDGECLYNCDLYNEQPPIIGCDYCSELCEGTCLSVVAVQGNK